MTFDIRWQAVISCLLGGSRNIKLTGWGFLLTSRVERFSSGIAYEDRTGRRRRALSLELGCSKWKKLLGHRTRRVRQVC